MVCVFEWKKVDNLILEPQNRRKEGSTDTCMDDGKDEIGVIGIGWIMVSIFKSVEIAPKYIVFEYFHNWPVMNELYRTRYQKDRIKSHIRKPLYKSTVLFPWNPLWIGSIFFQRKSVCFSRWKIIGDCDIGSKLHQENEKKQMWIWLWIKMRRNTRLSQFKPQYVL